MDGPGPATPTTTTADAVDQNSSDKLEPTKAPVVVKGDDKQRTATKGAKVEPPKEPAVMKPATASREDNLVYDLKHMAAFDISPLHASTDMQAYARDSVQLLVNHLFALPREKSDDGVMAVLPTEEMFKIPRQKPVPKQKEKTRWQKFMEDRNMKKRKRSRLVYDEVSGDWKPRWGYNSIKKSEDKANWVHEVQKGEDPYANPFERQKAEKKLTVARQKMREVRNKVEAAGGKIRASVPDLQAGGSKRGTEALQEAVKRAQTSSASFGKFDRVAKNEATNLQPKNRKKATVSSTSDEKQRYLKAANRIFNNEGNVDSHKAAKAGAPDTVPRKAPKTKSKRRSKQTGPPPKSRRGNNKGKR